MGFDLLMAVPTIKDMDLYELQELGKTVRLHTNEFIQNKWKQGQVVKVRWPEDGQIYHAVICAAGLKANVWYPSDNSFDLVDFTNIVEFLDRYVDVEPFGSGWYIEKEHKAQLIEEFGDE